MPNTTVAYKAPEIPDKWSIIPIHTSDRANFRRCRQYWSWSSPSRHNLHLRADIHGVNPDLWFGTGIHWALEQFYQPGLSRDPVEAWKTWFDIQWRGGVVTEEWLDRVYDLRPQRVDNWSDGPDPGSFGGHPYSDNEKALGYGTENDPRLPKLYRVRGLEDIIPSPDTEKFDELYQLGINMMMFYKEYAAKHDEFSILVTEHDFSIPIWNYSAGCILKAIDTREESPNFGKELEVHARGRTDAIGIYHSNEKLFIHDYKTAAKIGEDYFEKLETDEQCTSYLYAIKVEAEYYDLPYRGTEIEEVLYTALRKTYPKPPTVVRGGMFSIDRTNESCTYEMLMDWIKRNAPGVQLSEKQQAYVDYLYEIGDEQFIMRDVARRNKHQIADAGQRLSLEAMDMLYDPRIYPNMSNDFLCMKCQFRAPCLAKMDGSDWQQMIKDNYISNRDR